MQLIIEEGTACPLLSELRYDSRDPYAVTLVVSNRECRASWTFARELLLQGICEPAGDGDVHVWPGLTDEGEVVLLIEMDASDGEIVLAADQSDVEAFVMATSELVQPGCESEHLDVDALIAAIFEAVANDRSDG